MEEEVKIRGQKYWREMMENERAGGNVAPGAPFPQPHLLRVSGLGHCCFHFQLLQWNGAAAVLCDGKWAQKKTWENQGTIKYSPNPPPLLKKKKKSNRNHIGSLSSVASERIVFYFSTVSRYLSQRSCFSGRKDYGWLHPINLKSFLRKRDGVERAKWLSTAWEQQAQLQWIAVPMLVGFPARSRHAAVAQLPAHQRQSL